MQPFPRGHDHFVCDVEPDDAAAVAGEAFQENAFAAPDVNAHLAVRVDGIDQAPDDLKAVRVVCAVDTGVVAGCALVPVRLRVDVSSDALDPVVGHRSVCISS